MNSGSGKLIHCPPTPWKTRHFTSPAAIAVSTVRIRPSAVMSWPMAAI